MRHRGRRSTRRRRGPGPRPRPPGRSAASWPCCGPAATPPPARAGARRSTGSPRRAGSSSPSSWPRAVARRRPQLRAPSGLRPPPGPPGPAGAARAPPRPAGPAPGRGPTAPRVELDVYARSVVEHTADGVAQDISWLDRLIASERAATRPTHRPNPPTPNSPTKETSDEQPIRLAIAGVGNCASSLIQGINYYRDAEPDDVVPGLMHVELGGYHVRDLVPVAAFDVDQAKVGTDLGKAIFAGQNNTIRFAEVGELGRHRPARPDPRRAGQVLPRGGRGVARPPRSTWPRPCATPGPTCWSPTCRSAPSRPSATTPRPASTPASPSSTPSRSSSPRTPSGPASSATPACRSSATTSRARWARPSCTASSPASSRTAGWPSTTPTSSTSAATWTSRTCSSATASSRRRSRRPRP